jgi:hypothetical protein
VSFVFFSVSVQFCCSVALAKGSTKCRLIEFVPSVIVDGLLKGKKIRAPLFVVGVKKVLVLLLLVPKYLGARRKCLSLT